MRQPARTTVVSLDSACDPGRRTAQFSAEWVGAAQARRAATVAGRVRLPGAADVTCGSTARRVKPTSGTGIRAQRRTIQKAAAT